MAETTTSSSSTTTTSNAAATTSNAEPTTSSSTTTIASTTSTSVSTSEDAAFEVINGIKLIKFRERDDLIDDTVLKRVLNRYYTQVLLDALKILHKGINFDKCGETIKIPYFIKYLEVDGKKTIVTPETSDNKNAKALLLKKPIFTKNSLIRTLEANNINIDESLFKTSSFLRYLDRDNYENNETNETSITNIGNEYAKCKYFQYFIPLGIFGVYDPSGHSNLLLFNKSKKIVTWIEPKYDPDDTLYVSTKELIINTIRYILREALNRSAFNETGKIMDSDLLQDEVDKFSIDVPRQICPQAIAKDKNCMFWTFLLTLTLVENPDATIDDVSSSYLKKYRKAVDLSRLMNNFKGFLFDLAETQESENNEELTPEEPTPGGKRRKTIRNKAHKRRGTHKLRKL